MCGSKHGDDTTDLTPCLTHPDTEDGDDLLHGKEEHQVPRHSHRVQDGMLFPVVSLITRKSMNCLIS